jgi:hypothetical protein
MPGGLLPTIAILSGWVTSAAILILTQQNVTVLPSGPSRLNLVEFGNRIIEGVLTTTCDNN